MAASQTETSERDRFEPEPSEPTTDTEPAEQEPTEPEPAEIGLDFIPCMELSGRILGDQDTPDRSALLPGSEMGLQRPF